MYIETHLNREQRFTLQKIFRHGFTQPHLVAQQLHIKRLEAIALLDKLVEQHPKMFTRKHLIYHTCSEAPVASIPDTKTIKQGWVCPECEEEVEMNEINLDLVYKAIAPVDFISPDDGLVRYWAIDYFPYYVKTCQKAASEPVMVLESKDAEKFDLILEGQAVSRQKAVARVEEDYKLNVHAIAKAITAL